MTSAPAALFDVDALRAESRPLFGAPRRSAPLVVLGSTQDRSELDEGALERDGIGVRRRRGGGGAVLLQPGDGWAELWLPATGTESRHDVRASAYQVGEWWRSALGSLGVEVTMHRGGVVAPAQGAVACFAGIGPGELLFGGAKLVGLSQWRAREGTLVSSVVSQGRPDELGRYLVAPARAARLSESVGLAAVLAGADGVSMLLDRLFGVAAGAVPSLRRDDQRFS